MIYIKRKRKKKHRQNKTKQTNKQVYVNVNKTRKEKLYKMSSIATPEQTSNANGHKVAPAKMKANIRSMMKSHEVPVGSYQDNNDGGDDVVAVVRDGDGGVSLSDEDYEEMNKALSDDPVEVDDDINGKELKRPREDDELSDGGSTVTTASSKGTPKKGVGGGGARKKKKRKVYDPDPSYWVQILGFFPMIAAAVFAGIKDLAKVKSKKATEVKSMLTMALQYLAQTLSKEQVAEMEAWDVGEGIKRFSDEDHNALKVAGIDAKDPNLDWSAVLANWMTYTDKVIASGDKDLVMAFLMMKSRVQSGAEQLVKAKDSSRILRLEDYFNKPRSNDEKVEAELDSKLLKWLTSQADKNPALFEVLGNRASSMGDDLWHTMLNMFETPLEYFNSLSMLTNEPHDRHATLAKISTAKFKSPHGFIYKACTYARKQNVGLINAVVAMCEQLKSSDKEALMKVVSSHTRLKAVDHYKCATISCAELLTHDDYGNLKLPERPEKKKGSRVDSLRLAKPDDDVVDPDVLTELKQYRRNISHAEPSVQLLYLEELWEFMQHFNLSSAQLTPDSQDYLQNLIAAMQNYGNTTAAQKTI